MNIKPTICNGHLPYTWDGVGRRGWEFDVGVGGGGLVKQNI